nr:MAG TPA: hypothetical protein [Caudoviricetes sp.]
MTPAGSEGRPGSSSSVMRMILKYSFSTRGHPAPRRHTTGSTGGCSTA